MKMIRFSTDIGCRCQIIGELVRETKTNYVYRSRNTGLAYISKQRAHIESCLCCPDHLLLSQKEGDLL
jgi:hypothetical protein